MKLDKEIDRRAALIAAPAASGGAVMRHIARGSAWMVAARWSMRGIGLLTTVILARLLEPADFGVVAIATITVGFIRVFAEAGQDLAVIRHPDPTPEHFDTAWTMSVCAGLVAALALVAVAPLAGWYYEDPRVVPVIRFIALAPLIEGFTNIGAAAGFRRELAFAKDFYFSLVRRIAVPLVAIPLVLICHDYWGLAIGIVGGRAISVGASYLMHPYRPRLRLPKIREIWSFSAWTQISEIGAFLGDHCDQIIVGGIAGTIQMGTYNVAEDLARVPTQEFVSPFAQAGFPVYSTLLHDPQRLAHSYLDVLSITAIIALSTGIGVALIADDMVAFVLGPKWAAAASLIPWLAFGAALLGVARVVGTIISVTGNARLNAMRLWSFAMLLAPTALLAGLSWGVEGVAAARMAITIVFVPLMFYSLLRVIPITAGDILARLWRPAIAALCMAAVLSLAETGAISSLPLRLLYKIGLGAAVFTTTLLGAWLIVGRPPGAERMLLGETLHWVRHARSKAAPIPAGPSCD